MQEHKWIAKKLCWMKNWATKGVHAVWIHVCEAPKLAKLVSGDRS